MAHGNVIKKRLFATLSLLLGSIWITIAPSVGHASANDSSASLDSLTFVTFEYPPYNYLDGDRVAGTTIDLLHTMLAMTGIALDSASIRYYPWGRGYQLALNRPNTVLISVIRTTHRESRFEWIGPIDQDHLVLLAPQGSDILVHSLNDAIAQGLSVAVIRDSIGDQALREAGYPDALLRPAIDSRSALHMLLNRRIDLWAYSPDVARWIAQREGYPADIVLPLYTLSESPLYFALNPETDPRLVTQLRQAFEHASSLTAQVDDNG